MKKFEIPEVEIQKFQLEDVITSSSDDNCPNPDDEMTGWG